MTNIVLGGGGGVQRGGKEEEAEEGSSSGKGVGEVGEGMRMRRRESKSSKEHRVEPQWAQGTRRKSEL